MKGYPTDLASVRGIVDYLNDKLNDDYKTDFERYGGVDVKLIHDESGTPEHVGRPMVLLNMSSGALSVFSAAQKQLRDVMLQVAVIVTKYIGGQVGTANRIASDEKLTNALDELLNDRQAMTSIGILNSSLSIGEVIEGGDPDNNRLTACTLTYTYDRRVNTGDDD